MRQATAKSMTRRSSATSFPPLDIPPVRYGRKQNGKAIQTFNVELRGVGSSGKKADGLFDRIQNPPDIKCGRRESTCRRQIHQFSPDLRCICCHVSENASHSTKCERASRKRSWSNRMANSSNNSLLVGRDADQDRIVVVRNWAGRWTK